MVKNTGGRDSVLLHLLLKLSHLEKIITVHCTMGLVFEALTFGWSPDRWTRLIYT